MLQEEGGGQLSCVKVTEALARRIKPLCPAGLNQTANIFTSVCGASAQTDRNSSSKTPLNGATYSSVVTKQSWIVNSGAVGNSRASLLQVLQMMTQLSTV